MSVKYDISICSASSDRMKKWGEVLGSHIALFLSDIIGTELKFNYTSLDKSDIKTALSESSALLVILDKDNESPDSSETLGENVFEIHVQQGIKNSGLSSRFIYNFYDIDENTNEVIEFFNVKGNSSTEEQYWNKLVDISFDLFLYLSKDKVGISKTVFLAVTTPDQNKNRDTIKRDLLHHGFEVLPKSPLSRKAHKLQKEIEDCISKSDLSIHIIGESEGKEIEGSDLGLADFQNKISSEISQKNNFPRLIWVSPDLKPKNEQAINIEKLKRDAEALAGAEVVQTPIELLKTIVIKNILSIEGKNIDTKENSISTKKKVYLMFEKGDKKNIATITNAINNSSVEIIESPFEGSDYNILSQHKKYLKNSDACLIYYNGLNPNWIKSKLDDVLKAPGYGRVSPLIATGLILNTDSKESPKVDKMDIILMESNGKDASKFLKPFIDKITSKL